MADQLADDIISKIKAHAEPESGEIGLDTELTALGIHSLELTEIIFDLEEAYGIEIEMNTVEAWSNLKNVGDMVEAVRGLIEKKPPEWRAAHRRHRHRRPLRARQRRRRRSGAPCATAARHRADHQRRRCTTSRIRIGAEIKQLPDHGIDRKRCHDGPLQPAGGDRRRRGAAPVPALPSTTATRTAIGAVVGVGVFGAETHRGELSQASWSKTSRAPTIFTVPKIMPGAPAGQVSMNLGLRGPVFGVTSACASSNHAFAPRRRPARLGRADVMVAGGTDAPLV